MTDRQPPEMRVSGAQSRPDADILPDCMMPDGADPRAAFLSEYGQRMEAHKRLRRIAAIIEHVDNRCMAADGPVTGTLQEMTQAEIREIYRLALLPTEAGTPALNTPPRSAERAALDVAVKAIRELSYIDKAIADIAALVPDAVKR